MNPWPLAIQSGSPSSEDEKDGRFCGKEGDLCKCFGKVRYGRPGPSDLDLT